MEKRQKNILIGSLLAIVLLMAVGYAAFATQLNINSTANISSSWNVHFDPTKTTGAGVLDVTTGTIATGETSMLVPTGSISYSNNNLTANLTSNLRQPGDKIVYTLTIVNEGNIKAAPSTPIISISGSNVSPTNNGDGTYTITKDHVQYTVTKPTRTLNANQTDTIIVESLFIDTAAGETPSLTATESAALSVTVSYTQGN